MERVRETDKVMACPVQRHAARALWHLTGTSQAGLRQRVLDGGGLNALLRLAKSGNKGVQAKALARRALKRLAQDPEVHIAYPDALSSDEHALSLSLGL